MKKRNIFLILSLSISVFVYIALFNFKNYTYSDWVYYFSHTLIDMSLFTPWTTLFDFGSFDTLLWNSPLQILY